MRDDEDTRALLSDTDADGGVYQRRDAAAAPAAAGLPARLDTLDDLDIDDDDDASDAEAEAAAARAPAGARRRAAGETPAAAARIEHDYQVEEPAPAWRAHDARAHTRGGGGGGFAAAGGAGAAGRRRGGRRRTSAPASGCSRS